MTVEAIVTIITLLMSAIGIISAICIMCAIFYCRRSYKAAWEEQEKADIEDLLRIYVCARTRTKPPNIVADVTDSVKIVE